MDLAVLYKYLAIVSGGTVGLLFGEGSSFLSILIIVMFIDQISGLVAGWYEGGLRSRIGSKGIFRKFVMILVVAVAHIIDVVLGTNNMIRDAIVFFYIGNEILSFIENVGRIGVPLPNKLKDAVAIIKEKGDR